MADFCKQCSEDLFGKDLKELAGLVSVREWNEGYAATVLCEGCGPIQVNPAGECISEDCLKKGHKEVR